MSTETIATMAACLAGLTAMGLDIGAGRAFFGRQATARSGRRRKMSLPGTAQLQRAQAAVRTATGGCVRTTGA
jgi:hypothetical protein